MARVLPGRDIELRGDSLQESTLFSAGLRIEAAALKLTERLFARVDKNFESEIAKTATESQELLEVGSQDDVWRIRHWNSHYHWREIGGCSVLYEQAVVHAI